MSSGWIVALELGVVVVGLVGFGAWELYGLRRDRRRREQTDADRQG